MINPSDETQGKRFRDALLNLALWDLPASLCVGLGLYGKFFADGDAFAPWLNDHSNLNALLAAGVAIWVVAGYRAIILVVNNNRARNDQDPN